MTRDMNEHQCRQGKRCAARTRDKANAWQPAGTERPNTLCLACESINFDAIRELNRDWGHLAASITTKRVTDTGPKVVSSQAHPTPIRLDVDALQNDIETELLRWARILTRGDQFPDRSGECVLATHIVVISRLGTLVDLPPREIVVLEPHSDGGDYVQRIPADGVDAILRLAKLHHRAEHVLQTRPVRIWLTDPCPACGRKALAASKDQARITCQGCRAVWDKDQFVRLGTVLDFDRRQPRHAS
jgi:hypothetical protein